MIHKATYLAHTPAHIVQSHSPIGLSLYFLRLETSRLVLITKVDNAMNAQSCQHNCMVIRLRINTTDDSTTA